MPTHDIALVPSAMRTITALLIQLDMTKLEHLIVVSLIFSLIGIVLFALAFWLIVKVTPFSIRKEIEDDQNSALAIVIA